MQSNRNKKLIIANSLLLILLVAGFAYAWFASNYGSTVDGDDVEVIADSALEISLTGQPGSWKNSINLRSDSGIDWTKLKFRDITGSGDGKSFLRPPLKQYDNNAMVDPSVGEWTDANVNEDYIKFDLYMRSTDKLDVYLGDGSFVQPLADQLIGPYSDATVADDNHKSSFGDFSKDLVTGAVRVSAVSPVTTTGHLFTWIPRPNIYLDLAADAALPNGKTYKELLSINAASTGTYTNGSPYVHTYYAAKNDTDTTTLPDTKTLTGDIVKDVNFTNATKANYKLTTLSTPSEGYFQEHVTVYIWLEGCDNEARRAFVGGKFKVTLALTAEDVVDQETP